MSQSLQQFLTELTTNPSALPWPWNQIPTAWNTSGITQATYYTWFHNLLQIYNAYGTGYQGYNIDQTLTPGLGTTAGGGGSWFPTPQFAGLGAGGYSWHSASAIKIGKLSVPPSWASSTGAAEQAATKLVSANFVSGSPGEANPASVGLNAALRGAPVGARGAQRAGNMGVRYGFRYNVLARPPSAG